MLLILRGYRDYRQRSVAAVALSPGATFSFAYGQSLFETDFALVLERSKES